MTPSKAQIKRATLAAHDVVTQLDASTAQELIDLYEQAAEDIGEKIFDAAGRSDNVTLAALRDLLDQVQKVLQNLSKERDKLLDGALESAADWGVRPYQPNAALGAAGMRTSTAALKFVRDFVAADGLQLSDRVWRLDRGARDRIVNAIEMAVIQGHSAGEAARAFLSRGAEVPADVANKLTAANARQLSLTAQDIMTGAGSPLNAAMNLFRTEINRAHGEAFMMAGGDHPDFAGWRMVLSPAHPEHDICDLLTAQNLYGLGSGVYPTREALPWPAHPNTLTFIEIKFKDEVTDADRAGQQTPIQALEGLTEAQQRGVLGSGKFEVFKAGKLTQGMIRSPWRAVERRVGDVTMPDSSTAPATISKGKGSAATPALDLDTALRLGAVKGEELLRQAAARGNIPSLLPEVIYEDLNKVRSTLAKAAVRSNGEGANLVRAASMMFPDDWTKAADAFGPLYARFDDGRGWQATMPPSLRGPRLYRGFKFEAEGNDGLIVAGRFATAVHEYTHRLQAALPGLDDLFQDLHHRRTEGDPIKQMRDLKPGVGYEPHEVTREDNYIEPYQGKVYAGARRYGALEVMTIAFEYVLGGNPTRLAELLKGDREMFDLVIGALYHYVP